jgi:hypothetical protein
MYLLWVYFQGRYIESPAGPQPAHKKQGLVFTSADGRNRERAGIHQVSFVAVLVGSVTGYGFLVKDQAGWIFTCFHRYIALNFYNHKLNLSGL